MKKDVYKRQANRLRNKRSGNPTAVPIFEAVAAL